MLGEKNIIEFIKEKCELHKGESVKTIYEIVVDSLNIEWDSDEEKKLGSIFDNCINDIIK